jgi:NADPH2:quinone reductase
MLSAFGPPSALTPVDLPDPVPGPGQVVVDVAFASITFVETQVRAGHPPNPAMAPRLPAVLGNGVGGVVIAAAEGTDPGLAGARVITATGGSGGYAERVAVPAGGLIVIPAALAVDDAVALLADGRTALALADAAQLRPGDTVLVEAAAGGVGSLLVQLARRAGARVIAAAGGQRKLDVARGLGADLGVDYREPGWPERVRAEVGAVDVVYDGVGAQIGRDAFALLAPAGRYVAFGMAGGSFAGIPGTDRPDVSRVTLGRLSAGQVTQLARSALDQAALGVLHPVIGQRFALAQAAEAHAAIEARATIGKTLLVTGAGAAAAQ